jgi:hypothetical protein
MDLDEATRTAAEGLRLCLEGDEAGGLKLYRTCALPRLLGRLPLGLHAQMIEDAGHGDAASALRALTLEHGGDLAWRAAVRPGTSPEVIATEYEGFFARGLANPAMVGGYVEALTSLGRADEVAALFDAERLIHQVRIGAADAVAAALLKAEDGLEYGSRQITHGMRYLLGVEQLRLPVFDALLAECRAETLAYFERWAESDHPLAQLVPRDFTIAAWAMVSRAEGYNSRHRHPVGWATGVYYPAGLPEGSTGGSLRIGGWSDPPPPGWPSASIRPEPGLLVLIPSWYVHWTEPTGAEDARLAIAFDAVPKGREG